MRLKMIHSTRTITNPHCTDSLCYKAGLLRSSNSYFQKSTLRLSLSRRVLLSNSIHRGNVSIINCCALPPSKFHCHHFPVSAGLTGVSYRTTMASIFKVIEEDGVVFMITIMARREWMKKKMEKMENLFTR